MALLQCSKHPERPAVIICQTRNSGFCEECIGAVELRCGICYYCPRRAGCLIQKFYRDMENSGNVSE